MDIHTPTTTSAPASSSGQGALSPALAALSARRTSLTSQLTDLVEILSSVHNATMTTPSLLTSDGFPRADIDVAQIRSIRASVIRLRNDLAAVEESISEEVVKQFSSAKPNGSAPPTATTSTSAPRHTNGSHGESQPIPAVVFAVVNTVAPNSPAESAGLVAGDHIVQFGSLNAGNHDGLKKLPTVVHEGQEVKLKVKRQGNQLVELTLTPRNGWGGRGMLGCHILPF